MPFYKKPIVVKLIIKVFSYLQNKKMTKQPIEKFGIESDHSLPAERYTPRIGFTITDIVSTALDDSEQFIILDEGAKDALSAPSWQLIEAKSVRLFS